MGLTEKAAFLKGLIEGSDLKLDKNHKKILDSMTDLLEEMARTVTDVDDDVSALYDDIDDICGELDDIESDLDTLFGEGCGCDEYEDGFMYDVQCEKCGETISVDEDTVLEGELICPSCGESIEIDLDCECGCGDDCDCRPKKKD